MGIIDEIRTNPEEGALRLEREYKKRLMAVALDVCNDSVEAEALVFDTLGDTVRYIESLENPEALFSWICRILVSRHNKATRRKSSERVVYSATLPEPPPDDIGVNQIIQEVDGKLLHEAIEHLPPKLKETVILRYFMDMPLLQVARFLMVPVGTVNSRQRISTHTAVEGAPLWNGTPLVFTNPFLRRAEPLVLAPHGERGNAAELDAFRKDAAELVKDESDGLFPCRQCPQPSIDQTMWRHTLRDRA